jgi:hypothetical protein
MRKIYLTMAMLISFGWAFAQTNQISVIKTEANQPTLADMANGVRKYVKNRDASSKTVKSRWYCFAFSMDEQLGNIAKVHANNLWPDSTILVNYSSGYSGPWIHALGEAINPASQYFQKAGELNINKYMPYTIDSIGFYCLYYRVDTSASVVDTLQFQILIGGDGNYYWEQGKNPWVYTDYGTDTLFFKGIKHDPLVNYTTNANYMTYKYPLTASAAGDTLSNGVHYFKLPVNLQVPAGETFVTAVQFIPGATWTANVDTITDFNHLRFISYEENGDGGGSGTLPSYTKRDWNCSYILPSSWMYKASSSVYAPSYAFVAGYGYEHHWIEFLLTADETGIAKTVDNKLSVGQNQPNPFSGTTTINYTLSTKENVNLTVYNVAGAKVMEINEGVKAAGTHTIQLNASDLTSGVYYYTITAGNSQITKKMIVY